MDACSYDMAPDLFDWFYENLSNGIKINALLEYMVKSRDPVDLLTGAFLWDYTDTALYGSHDLTFNRYYSSFYANTNEGLGYGWSSDYTAHLEFSGPTIKAVLPGGTSRTFVRAADGSFQSSAGSIYTLSKPSDGYLLERQDGVCYLFDSDGLIEQINYLDGNVLTFTNNDGLLSRVSNDAGTFFFEYNSDGNLATVTDSVGRVTTLGYDGDYLTSVTNTDGDTLRYTYDNNGYLTTVCSGRQRQHHRDHRRSGQLHPV